MREAEFEGIRMRESGDEFDAEVTNASGLRYRIRPILRYGRALPGGLLEVRSWSVWSYWLVDHPEIEAVPVTAVSNHERPSSFRCRFGVGVAAREIQLTIASEAKMRLNRAA